MDPNNFIVRPKRRYVEEFSNRERWDELTASDVLDISNNLAALPFNDDDEEMARRFDLLVLNLQLAILESSANQERLRSQVISLIGNLEEKQAIPSVAKQMELILEIQRDEYWENVTLPMLESARKKLRDLIKFIDKNAGQETIYTDFEDEQGEASEVDGWFGLIQSCKITACGSSVLSVNTKHIRRSNASRKTSRFILATSIRWKRFCSPTTAQEREEFLETYGSDEPLALLVRRIVGLDANAAKAAFAEFLAEGQYSADQIQFINLIIDHLVADGMMKPELLFAPPFTDFQSHCLWRRIDGDLA